MARVSVALLLVLALAVRVAEVERTSYRPINDGRSYLTLAGEVARTGDYSSLDRGAGGSLGPSAYFPPAYPYLLAAVDRITGHSSGPITQAVHTVRISQALLGTVTVALVWLVALELLGPTIALIALAIAAVYPVLVEMSGLIAAENLLVALVLGAVYTVLRSRRSLHPTAWIAAAGVLTGLAALTHENAILLLAPLVAAVWPRPRASLRSLRAAAVLVVTAALTILPWTIRNAIVLDRFIPVSDETGFTLRGTYNPTSAAFQEVPYKWRPFSEIAQDRPLAKQAPGLTETELDSRLTQRALSYISDHPLSPLVVAYHNTLRLLELEGSFAWRASAAAVSLPGGTAQIGVVGFWLLFVLAVIGAFTRAARAAPRWVWAVPILYGLSVVLVNTETPRFRGSIDPFLILLAACALGALPTLLSGRSPVGRGFEPPAPSGDRELVDVVKSLT